MVDEAGSPRPFPHHRAGRAMSTAAEKPAAKPAVKVVPLIPPEEKFWQRYSPNHEAPVSMSGSFGLHLLIGGGGTILVLLGFGADKREKNLPVEPVRLKMPGGGGGKKDGTGKGRNVGDPKQENIEGAPPQQGEAAKAPK